MILGVWSSSDTNPKILITWTKSETWLSEDQNSHLWQRQELLIQEKMFAGLKDRQKCME